MPENRTATYRAATREDAERAYHADARDAAGAGYVPSSEDWGSALGQQVLTVVYVHAPEQAPAVLAALAAVESLPATSAVPQSQPGGPPIAAPVAEPTHAVPTTSAGHPGRVTAKARWDRLRLRSKVAVVVVVLIVLGGIGSLGKGSNDLTALATSEPSPTHSSSAGPATSAAPSQPTLEPTDEPTPEITAVPTPVVTPGPAFATISLAGKGSKVPKFTIPADQAAIATITNKGSSNFAVWSVGADGQEQELLVNEIGSFVGTVLFDTSDHSVAFKIESDGSWTAKIAPVTAARAWDTAGTLTGKSDDVVRLVPPSSGFLTTTVTHKGSSNFAVWTYDSSGASLQVNEIGNYSGDVLLPDGTLLMQVTADGTWTFGAPK